MPLKAARSLVGAGVVFGTEIIMRENTPKTGRGAAGFFVFRAGTFFPGVCKHPRPTGIGGALHVVHECAGTIQSKSADLTSFSGNRFRVLGCSGLFGPVWAQIQHSESFFGRTLMCGAFRAANKRRQPCYAMRSGRVKLLWSKSFDVPRKIRKS